MKWAPGQRVLGEGTDGCTVLKLGLCVPPAGSRAEPWGTQLGPLEALGPAPPVLTGAALRKPSLPETH